jgi:hypothetical protein
MAELTFLMNADPAGSGNRFYHFAKKFFEAAGSTIEEAPASGQTLEGIFDRLRAIGAHQSVINLVSHASGFGSMECPITRASQTSGRRTMTVDDLQDALANKTLAPPGPAIVSDKTKIVIYGCDVGRTEAFLKMLSGLFGDPGELLAPKRMGVFMLDGTTVKYRQARTWSVVRKAPLLAAGQAAPTGGWPAFRTTFVADADTKFARIAIQIGLNGGDEFKTLLGAAANTATTTLGPSFFFEEGVDIFPTGTQSAAEAAASVKPRSNGDPVKSVPAAVADVDDTALVTTISSADAYKVNPAGTRFAITVILLVQIIEEEVVIAEGLGYRRITTSKGLAPAVGPKPATGSGGGGGGPAASPVSELQNVLNELLAAGAAQADIDALLADIPSGDAAEGLAMDVEDVPDLTDEPTDPMTAGLS